MTDACVAPAPTGLRVTSDTDDSVSLSWNAVTDAHYYVGNQQKWDTFVKERSGGNGSVVGLPEQVVVAFAAG